MTFLGESIFTNAVIKFYEIPILGDENIQSKLLSGSWPMILEYRIPAVLPGNIYDPTLCHIVVHLPLA